MDVQEVLSKGFVLVLDPTSERYGTEGGSITDPNAFLAEYGGWLEEIAIVAKAENGKVTYQSAAAPKHQNAIFPDFVELANDLGIKTYAIIHSMGDQYFSQDFDYGVVRSGGTQVRHFICPSQISFWKYLGAVSREIAKYPVEGLVFLEFMFPRREFCFCRRCSRGFSDLTGISADFTFNTIVGDPEYYERFIEWRSEILTAAFEEVFAAARTVKPDINLIPVVDIDPETGWKQGTKEHFGYEVDKLVATNPFLGYHLMPFSPIAPEPGSTSWEDLRAALHTSPQFEGSYDKSLVIWGLEQEEDGAWILQLKDETNAKRIFGRLNYPASYNVKREIHRGIS